jgi:hypothetical protein
VTGESRVGGSLTIAALEFDPDYLVIEIRARNDRFSGETHIWAGPDDLTRLADCFAGFPRRAPDARRFELRSVAAFAMGQGRAVLSLRTTAGAGDAWFEVALEDDYETHPLAVATFGFRTEAADVDRFVAELQHVVQARGGEARLTGVGLTSAST